MKLFHWLKCDWTKWSDPTPQKMCSYDRWTKSTHDYWVHLQRRKCNTCNKTQERQLEEE